MSEPKIKYLGLQLSWLHLRVIKSVKHKGLKLLFEKGNVSKLPAAQINRIEDILSALNVTITKEDMNAPGAGFHELKGDLKGFCAVKVTGNYRQTQ